MRNNTIRGGISLNSGSALTNTVRNGGISVGTGSLVQGNDVENASGWGISASGNVTVTHNRVVGNASGVNMSGGLVHQPDRQLERRRLAGENSHSCEQHADRQQGQHTGYCLWHTDDHGE